MKCEQKELKLLPCAPDVCQECAVKHDPEDAHNQQSLYYQMNFNQKYGRFPKWEDAIAHCSIDIQNRWKVELRKHGVDI